MYILGIQRNKLEWFNNDRFYQDYKWLSRVVLCWADPSEIRETRDSFFFLPVIV